LSVGFEKNSFRNESIRGFYKGLAPNLLRVVPATAITFVVYEKSVHFLAGFRKPAANDKPPPSPSSSSSS
jgi:solute carrier family 25 folate transporter 32